MTFAVALLEISFIGLAVIVRVVEPGGLRALSQRLMGLPRPRSKGTRR